MKKSIVAAVALALLIVAGVGYTRHQRREQVRATLAYGRLAPLPAGAANLRVSTAGGFFSRTFWLSFQASETEITSWLAQARTLTSLTESQFTPADYHPAQAPGWYRPGTIRPARRQVFRLMAEDAVYGIVWIDWQTGTVYLAVSRS